MYILFSYVHFFIGFLQLATHLATPDTKGLIQYGKELFGGDSAQLFLKTLLLDTKVQHLDSVIPGLTTLQKVKQNWAQNIERARFSRGLQPLGNSNVSVFTIRPE